jgi:hypothetical protein
MVGADHKTVGATRAELEGRGEIPHVDAHTDTAGRQQQATKGTGLAKPPAVPEPPQPKRAPAIAGETGGETGGRADGESETRKAAGSPEAPSQAGEAGGEAALGPAVPPPIGTDEWTPPPLPALLQAWNQASDTERKDLQNVALDWFNQIINFGRKRLAEDVLERLGSHAGNNGHYELIGTFLDTVGAKRVWKSASPRFKTAARDPGGAENPKEEA